MSRVLVVDDEKNLRTMLAAILEAEGHTVRTAENAGAARRAADSFVPHAMLVDLVMDPGPSGVDVLEAMKTDHPDVVVVMMSGQATLDDAVRATKLGAFQFLEKPLNPENVIVTVRAALDLAATRGENRSLRAQLPAEETLIGDSPELQAVRDVIAQVAPTGSTVLITGESGTGKELVARAIHATSRRAGRPFVAVNCAAVPRDLIESEMFGHERGAFTGAHERRRGRFELADGGTLFLDEVGDLDVQAQAKLLRVIETGMVEAVGSDRGREVDVRLVAATNRELEESVNNGGFRNDLYYRLNVFPVRVPALRDRSSDVTPLALHFAQQAGVRCGRPAREISADAMAALRAYRWPGNVRELANLIERLTILGVPTPITAAELAPVLTGGSRVMEDLGSAGEAVGGLADQLADFERRIITQALGRAKGNVAEAARRLDTDRANLYRRMRRLGMSPSDTDRV